MDIQEVRGGLHEGLVFIPEVGGGYYTGGRGGSLKL